MNCKPQNRSAPFAVVVNDDPTQLNILSGLVRKAGLEPRSFTGVEAALTDMATHTITVASTPGVLPALVVTDLYMPGIDGWRLCRLLRSPEYARFNEVPILVVSATFAGDHSESIAADVGANAFLPSPVDGKAFTTQVLALLSGQVARRLPRVLIVEDGKALSGLLKKTFTANGYRVDTALTVREAEAAFAKTPYDVAVLDYHLPDGTGDAVLDTLQTERPDCACLMMTTDPTPELALDWMKRGAAAYLRKPFEPEFLIELCAKARRERALLRAEDLLEARTRELRESEAFLSRSQEIAHIGSWKQELTANHLTWSDEVYRIFGYEPQDFVATYEAFLDAVHPDDRALVDEVYSRSLREGSDGYEIEHRIIRRNSGEVRYVLDRCVHERDDAGTIIQSTGMVQDITKRKQSEEKLRLSEECFRALAEASFGGIIIHDKGLILECNQGLSDITGFSYEEHIGMNGLELIAPESMDTVLANIQSGYDQGYEVSGVRKDGSKYPLAIRGKNITYKGREARVIEFRDITNRKQAEAEREKLQSQLQQAQKLEAIGTLAGGIAHDFNNILGAIVGYSEMIRDDFSPGSPSIHDINQVIKASHRAKDLVKQILAFSRQVEDQKIPVQAAVIVKEAISLLRSSLPTTITINQDIDADAGVVLADPTQIHQIVMNLSTNAFHAMEVKGGMLTISLQKKILPQEDLATIPDLQPGTFVQLSIRDTGEGILPEIRGRIFDPFFTTKEVGKGTGLGLSMVYSIVKSCNGSIACNSRLGEGTEFCILLPALEGPAIEENESTGLTPHGKEHILLVDDEEMLAELGQAMLERLGYHVTTRTNSLDALTTFQNQPDAFDLIITDQTMPAMTGLDLARQILQIRPEMPIILCTGYSSLINEDKAKALGIKGFAVKPLAKKDIGELIRKVLDGKNS